MLAALSYIMSTTAAIGESVLWAIVTGANLMFLAIGAALTAALLLLPTMSDAPAIGDHPWLHWANWFFPIGDCLGILTSGVTMFVVFLAIRYTLRLVRMI